MLTHNKEKWGDKVRIIGLSIDQDRAKLQNHVKDKGWTAVEHYWARNGKCTADKDFKLQGVPHCALVDTHGKIVWIGHPSSRKLEEDINALLEGKEISGVEGDAEDEEGAAEASGDLDFEKAGDAAAIFKLQSSELFKTEDFKEKAKALARGFVVLVTETKLNAKEHKTTTSMTCHTVIVGPKDSVGSVQAVTIGLTHADGALWKNKEQIREM